MQRIDHPLLPRSLGSQTTLSSFHFGVAGQRPKVYIQASLHAEELPGMLVAHHLRALLEKAEAAGEIKGEVVLVPVANPIGLAQRLDHKPMGRFDLDSGDNFNRHYPNLAQAIGPAVLESLGADAPTNVDTVREALRQHLAQSAPATELQSLRHTLLTLAFDADSVLDLHCDCESVLHFYTDEACWPQLAALAHYLQAETILLAKNSGSGSFDECLSDVWCHLAEALKTSGNPAPLPQGCCSTTIELRGELDVSHALAQADALALVAWLQHTGAIVCQKAPDVPPARCQPTPLAGSETVKAPCPGLVVFAAKVGDRLKKGDLVAEIIDPINKHTHRVLAGVDGVMYARILNRFVCSGEELAKIAGATPFRTGQLLGA
jgi:hypothetical protein